MNSFNSRPFARNASKTFRPAFDYLSNISRSTIQLPTTSKQTSTFSTATAHRRKVTSDSIDGLDDDIENNATMSNMRAHSRHSSQEAGGLAPAIPLIDVGSRSGTPNPYPRSRSAAQSEDEDDEYEISSSIRPLVGGGRASQYEKGDWKMIFRQGGLGGFLHGTWLGWQIWIGILVFWVGGCGFGLLLMNRFIMLTGVYKWV